MGPQRPQGHLGADQSQPRSQAAEGTVEGPPPELPQLDGESMVDTGNRWFDEENEYSKNCMVYQDRIVFRDFFSRSLL